MDIQAEIKWITSEIAKVRDPELINVFKSLLKYREKQVSRDWADDMSETEQQTLEKAIEESERGELISHDEVMKEARKRFKLK